MSPEGKAGTRNFADVVDEVARRLRLPSPDPKVIEMAAQDLEQMARDLRSLAGDASATEIGHGEMPPPVRVDPDGSKVATTDVPVLVPRDERKEPGQ